MNKKLCPSVKMIMIYKMCKNHKLFFTQSELVFSFDNPKIYGFIDFIYPLVFVEKLHPGISSILFLEGGASNCPRSPILREDKRRT